MKLFVILAFSLIPKLAFGSSSTAVIEAEAIKQKEAYIKSIRSYSHNSAKNSSYGIKYATISVTNIVWSSQGKCYRLTVKNDNLFLIEVTCDK